MRPVLWYGADVDEVYSPEDYEQFVADGVADGLVPLYAEPPKREWVGLTDKDLEVFNDDVRFWAKYWEAKLKEKNSER